MVEDWKYLYKIDYERGHNTSTNMLYTATINFDGSVMCMEWDAHNDYQNANTKLTDTLVKYFFDREVKHLKIMQQFDWAPKLVSIEGNKIYIEFNKETLNHILLTPGRSLDKECPNWKEQIFNIKQSLRNPKKI